MVWNTDKGNLKRGELIMTKEEIAYEQIQELKAVIREGNKKMKKPDLPSRSIPNSKRCWSKLLRTVERVTGEKIDFNYYYFG